MPSARSYFQRGPGYAKTFEQYFKQGALIPICPSPARGRVPILVIARSPLRYFPVHRKGLYRTGIGNSDGHNYLAVGGDSNERIPQSGKLDIAPKN
jgi:hypothetical protein